MASCILYQNADKTIVLLDIPRSIEQAQGFQHSENMRLLSSKAIELPFPSVEPKSAKALRNVESASVRTLLLERFVRLALDEVHTEIKGVWCLPRVTQGAAAVESQVLKRQAFDVPEDVSEHASKRLSGAESELSYHKTGGFIASLPPILDCFDTGVIYHNVKSINKHLHAEFGHRMAYIPPKSSFLHGEIENTCTIFSHNAPQFNLVILDPPWPNRSARRKRSYKISGDTSDVTALLSSIPLASHLADDALVGIWVTNKPAIHDLVLGNNGLFDSWGLEFVEEWVWLKVTTSGETICTLDSTWRKPYEILLLGQKSRPATIVSEFRRRVIIGVPDLHSRKPNLKALFEPMLASKYEALEIFARNLTNEWWAWGNEVLKFQGEEHWLDRSNDT